MSASAPRTVSRNWLSRIRPRDVHGLPRPYPAASARRARDRPLPGRTAGPLPRGHAGTARPPRTGTDLGRELGLAKSSVSEHTKALRAARLVTARRDGRTVWHSCTPLGLGLLGTWGGL
ncbi:winged helix-turn-helix domain-containing protein [Streptomyces sp. NPDC059649]|uniref:helix-turn-helix domain-containing protein n=1 Tax=Streptomyces sp. NPDC059649 TaxID=3346895 RepID=UPI0036C11201